jgi:hypothetical protein
LGVWHEQRAQNPAKSVSRYYQDGSPRPEKEIKAAIARRAADKKWKKANGFTPNSHWSVRRSFYQEEIDGFRATLAEILGEDEARSIVHGMRVNSRVAASEALKRARARKALTSAAKGRGRPRTPEQRLAAMMVSVEAYVGAGLRRDQALDHASKNWGNSRLEDIYKKEAKLPHDRGSELLRAFFHKIQLEEVDRFIAQFRASETGGE